MGDYTLIADSAVIDAGDPATVNEMGFDGYIPVRADIGAFERELFIESPDNFFQETGGQVVVEAEHFTFQLRHSGRIWETQTRLAGYVGPGYVDSLPDTDAQFTASLSITSPELHYTINFATAGTYYVWLRGYSPNGAGDSVYVGLDNELTTTILTGFVPREWIWANTTPYGLAMIEIIKPGLHTLHLWQREDGLRIDRIVLTTDINYHPIGNGPSASQRLDSSK
jgi:hypothetical protein